MRKTVSLVLLALSIAACAANQSENADHHLKQTAQSPSSKQQKQPAPGISSELIDQIIKPFNKGVALMDRYEPLQAVKEFEEVVRLAPNWTTGRLNLAIALLNCQTEENYARAEQELKRVVTQDPNNPYAHYALGMLLRQLGRSEEARGHFEAVLRIDPEDADAHYQLGGLISDQEPAAAIRHYEKTLEKLPHHESAAYALQGLLRRTGEKEKAKEMLNRFRELKESNAGVFFGMKYGEMGRYAEVVRAFESPKGSAQTRTAPAYIDIAKKSGLVLEAEGNPGWPGTESSALGPGLAVSDIESNGSLAVYIPGIGPDRGGALYRNDNGRLSLIEDSGIDGKNAVGAYFGDYDKDGDPDLYLSCAGPNRLYRNDGGAKFTDITKESGTAGGELLSVGATWADADHDGDLDLYVANLSPSGSEQSKADGAPNALFRNNGDGTFTDVAPQAGIDGGKAASMGVLFFDFDDDRDLDLYVINHGSANRLFLNDRVGNYRDATSWFPELADAGPGLGAVVGDLDQNGWEDILLLRGEAPPRLFLQWERASFVEDSTFAATARKLGGAAGALVGDLNLDGALDLVLLSSGSEETTVHRILMNKGAGRFAAPIPLGAQHGAAESRGAVAVDLDRDGSLELLVSRIGAPPQLWHTPTPPDGHWLEVVPVMNKEGELQWIDPTALGLRVEVKSARQIQVGSLTSSSGYLGGTPRRVHFGLGARAKADYVRLSWADAVLQSELEVAANQSWRIAKVKRKPSSCPVLFCWDGEQFAFVTDFLGTGGVGFFVAPGEYAPPDPTEDVRIPPELIKPRNGRYQLRIAEPLEEVTYLDQINLIAYDHPEDWEVYPDERFTGSPPFPSGKAFAVADKIFPRAAKNFRGEDVLERILEIDRRYAEPPKDVRFVGYAKDHWLELDFKEQLREIDPRARLVLYLYGWVEYTYSHVNYAAHQAGLSMRSPWIEVPDGNGGWRTALKEAGFPAGLPRMMTLDISDLPLRTDGRLRIRSNMEVFWDQVFIGQDVSGSQLRKQTLQPVVAELRLLGYPREYSPDGFEPVLYDYRRIDQGVPFKNLTGNFTRFGDVRELLRDVDDRFVVMARGEEIALEFDSTALPALPRGWSRTFVLHSDGYCKDMDLYTAFPDTVDPLPYHGMKNYPPEAAKPDNQEQEDYLLTWNTRHIVGDERQGKSKSLKGSYE